MFTGYGTVHYYDNEFRLILQVEQDLMEYYRSLIPLYLRVNPPRWPAHITVVRPGFDLPGRIRHWEDYEGEKIEFLYDPYLQSGTGYYWINCWSKRLEIIRTELGLENLSRFPVLPFGHRKTFHCTIGKYVEVFDFEHAPKE